MDIQLRLRYFQSLKPCGLQKLIPNHQFSFCWIYLLLLTLVIIRSSCPPSHHWASQEFHFAGLNPISLVGLSRWPREGRYPKHINWSLGFPGDVGSWGGVVVSEFSGAWGKRGEGGQGREGVQLPDSLMNEAVLHSAGPRLKTPQSLP